MYHYTTATTIMRLKMYRGYLRRFAPGVVLGAGVPGVVGVVGLIV